MLMFSMTIKGATVYSISIIFFSQLSKLITIAFTTGFVSYDLTMLLFVVPSGVIGGMIGSMVSKVLSTERVKIVFQTVILLVLLMNIYNGWQLLF